MKTISARDVSREFSRVRHEVEGGETYEVTHRDRVVMRMVPVRRRRTLADLASRMDGLPRDAEWAATMEKLAELTHEEVSDPWAER